MDDVLGKAWRLAILLLLLALPAQASQSYSPKPGTAERAAVIGALRAAVMTDLRKPMKFLVHHMSVMDGSAFVIATPQRLDGRAFDYSGTQYEAMIQDGMFEDRVAALLKLEQGKWRVVALDVGSTDVPYIGWAKEYAAPPAIFP